MAGREIEERLQGPVEISPAWYAKAGNLGMDESCGDVRRD